MSKKKFKRQKQRKRFPWPFVAIGGVLLLLAAFFIANRSGGDNGALVR